MAEILSKEQCPECAEEGRDSAKDNLVTFESGVKHCVAGHGTLGKDESIKKKEVELVHVGEGLKQGVFAPLPSRNISKSTCEFYNYMVNFEEKIQIANYLDVAGNIKMQQIRTIDKKFPVYGDKNYNNTLWGMHLFTPSDQVFITITEGQIDTLSVAEAFSCKYPVVSLPRGVGTENSETRDAKIDRAAKVLEHNKKYLDGFKYVVLAFDNDEPGRKATQDCIKLFEPGKVRVAQWPEKDANDLKKKGDESGIRKTIYNATEYIPAPILTGDALLNTLKEYSPKSRPWPWATANRIISPIFVPGIYTIAALPCVGKTTLMADIMRSVIESGGKVGVISLEETVQKMLIKLTSAIMGLDLKHVRNRALTEEEIEQCRPVAQSIVTYDHKTYGSSLTSILENLPYIARSLSCEFIMFDNLSYSATGLSEDERRGIDQAMIQLKDSSTKYEYTLFNVCHLNDDSDDVSQASIRGSRGVHMYSDYEIYLSRDVESDNPFDRNTLKFYIKKDRETGEDVGKSFKLYYNSQTQRLEDML